MLPLGNSINKRVLYNLHLACVFTFSFVQPFFPQNVFKNKGVYYTQARIIHR